MFDKGKGADETTKLKHTDKQDHSLGLNVD